MIELHKLTGQQFVVNADLIKTIESVPDTIITLTTCERIYVKEPVAQVVSKVEIYKQKIFGTAIGVVGETTKRG